MTARAGASVGLDLGYALVDGRAGMVALLRSGEHSRTLEHVGSAKALADACVSAATLALAALDRPCFVRLQVGSLEHARVLRELYAKRPAECSPTIRDAFLASLAPAGYDERHTLHIVWTELHAPYASTLRRLMERAEALATGA